MKIKLYTNVYEDAQEKDLRFLELTIKGKLIHHLVLPKDEDELFEGVYQNNLRRFSYVYDDTYCSIFPDLKLNTKVKIFHSSIDGYEEPDGFEYRDDSEIAGKEGYCYLNAWQRFTLDRRFKELWIQKEENSKWIIATLITALGVFAALAIRP